MTVYLDLSTDEKIERFLEKLEKLSEREDEALDIFKILEEFREKENERSPV